MRLVVLLALAACNGSGHVACPFGDKAAPMQLEVFHLDEQATIYTTANDDLVPLQIPPQGGWAVVLGVRATNLDGCEFTLTTSFRDLCSDTILKVDQRTAMLAPEPDGRGITTLETVSNLQLCPTPTARRHLFGEPFRFTIEVTDFDGKYGSTEVRFTPVCPAGATLCECECDQRYVLGTCPPTGPEPPPPC